MHPPAHLRHPASLLLASLRPLRPHLHPLGMHLHRLRAPLHRPRVPLLLAYRHRLRALLPNRARLCPVHPRPLRATLRSRVSQSLQRVCLRLAPQARHLRPLATLLLPALPLHRRVPLRLAHQLHLRATLRRARRKSQLLRAPPSNPRPKAFLRKPTLHLARALKPLPRSRRLQATPRSPPAVRSQRPALVPLLALVPAPPARPPSFQAPTRLLT